MNLVDISYAGVLILFSLMALRAFLSGSRSDYLLCGAQSIGVLAMLGPYRQIGAYLLLLTAVAYLASQIATGARPLSRALPITGALVVVFYLVAVHS